MWEFELVMFFSSTQTQSIVTEVSEDETVRASLHCFYLCFRHIHSTTDTLNGAPRPRKEWRKNFVVFPSLAFFVGIVELSSS